MRIFALSDIHINYAENKDWLFSLSLQDYIDDILILAGDISHNIDDIKLAFNETKKRFKEVFYVPGNHDLWVKIKEQNSLQRFEEVMTIAKNYEIETQYKMYDTFAIVPILSWYDYSFGEVTDDLSKRWADFFRCSWENMNDFEVTEYFMQKNILPSNPQNLKIISFSHFLPRIDIIHSGRITKFLAPVLGTSKLEDIIRSISSHTHIYGHSHINVFTKRDNVLYINNAFGYPNETHIASKRLLMVL